MRLFELMIVREQTPEKIHISLPVGLKDNTFRQLRALGFPVLDDKAAPQNQWSFIIQNKFKSSPERIEELLRSRLNHTGFMSVDAV